MRKHLTWMLLIVMSFCFTGCWTTAKDLPNPDFQTIGCTLQRDPLFATDSTGEKIPSPVSNSRSSAGAPLCTSAKEDVNFNSKLDAGEDTNGNGVLDGGVGPTYPDSVWAKGAMRACRDKNKPLKQWCK